MVTKETIIPEHYTGDTFDGVVYTIKVNQTPLDITGFKATLKAMSVNVSKPTKYQIVLELTNPTVGQISIPKQIISWPADTYKYEITFVHPNGDVKTWIKGVWKISEKL